MRGYLIDTNVISEYNREQLPHVSVVKWLDTTPEAPQYVSVLTLAEIEKGILRKDMKVEGIADWPKIRWKLSVQVFTEAGRGGGSRVTRLSPGVPCSSTKCRDSSGCSRNAPRVWSGIAEAVANRPQIANLSS